MRRVKKWVLDRYYPSDIKRIAICLALLGGLFACTWAVPHVLFADLSEDLASLREDLEEIGQECQRQCDPYPPVTILSGCYYQADETTRKLCEE